VRTGTYKETDAVPPFAARGLSGCTDEETDWRRKWERLKHYGSTIGLQAAVYLGHRPWALMKEEEELLIVNSFFMLLNHKIK
jgi:hypothetical protein